nr:megakaryocyte and platelet inhibitory receptor G6b isoform X2 [Chelonoidis abingdonii]
MRTLAGRRPEPMGSAIWVLLVPGPLRGSPPQPEVRGAGDQILLPCGAPGPRVRWVWAPRYPKCAGNPGNLLEISWLPPGLEPPPARFRGRLDPHPSAPGVLLLRDLVMSDSGTFTCLRGSGPEPPIQLEVTGGCRNNLTVSSNWTSPSALTLRCGRCPLSAGPASFRWFLKSQPLGNQLWATKREWGATVRLDPSRRAAWGHWECRRLGAASGGFEFCVEPPLRAGGTGPGSEWGIWVAAAAALGLIGAGLGAWCLWRRRRGRNQRNQNKRENETGERETHTHTPTCRPTTPVSHRSHHRSEPWGPATPVSHGSHHGSEPWGPATPVSQLLPPWVRAVGPSYRGIPPRQLSAEWIPGLLPESPGP